MGVRVYGPFLHSTHAPSSTLILVVPAPVRTLEPWRERVHKFALDVRVFALRRAGALALVCIGRGAEVTARAHVKQAIRICGICGLIGRCGSSGRCSVCNVCSICSICSICSARRRSVLEPLPARAAERHAAEEHGVHALLDEVCLLWGALCPVARLHAILCEELDQSVLCHRRAALKGQTLLPRTHPAAAQTKGRAQHLL